MNIFSSEGTWKERVMRAGFWTIFLQAADQVVMLVRVLILAVLLWPRDFGLFGIALLTIMAVDIFSKTGFNEALVHREGDIEPYLNTHWTVEVIRGFFLAALVFVAAPLVGAFYREPGVVPLLRVISLALILLGLVNPAAVYFQKRLAFHKEFVFRFSGSLADFLVAVTLALLFRSAWALVLGYLTGVFVRLVVSYVIQPYRPRFSLEGWRAKELFAYGVWILFDWSVVFLGEQGAGIVVGRVIGVTALGFFLMAQRIPRLTAGKLAVSVGRVAFPAYAEIQGSPGGIKRAYRRITGITAAMTFPAAVGIAVLGGDLTRILMGQKWVPMTGALTILALAYMIMSVAITGRSAFRATGNPRTVFWMQGARTATVLALVWPLSKRWGIEGAAVAIFLGAISMLTVWYVNIRRQLDLSAGEVMGIFSAPLAASGIMAAVLYLARGLTLPLAGGRPAEMVWAVLMVLLGAGVYFAALHLIRLIGVRS